jgi:hypothetical protein
MPGQSQKKRKAVKQHAYDVRGRKKKRSPSPPPPPKTEPEPSRVHANEFFYMAPLFLMEFLNHVDLCTIMLLARCGGRYARDLIKSFFAVNLRVLVELFVGNDNVDAFYECMEAAFSAMAGSTVSAALTFPYRHK